MSERRVADLVMFGAPGSVCDADGVLRISAAGVDRARLAARHWLADYREDRREPMRVICVAGRPGKRQGMPDLGGQTEADAMNRLVREYGVPSQYVVPGPERPLGREYATSTVDEVAILVEAGLTPRDRYSPASPLALVLHRRHGRRAIDIWRKVGFDRRHLMLLSPPGDDAWAEIPLRLAYRAFVLGTNRVVEPDVPRRREERFHRHAGFMAGLLVRQTRTGAWPAGPGARRVVCPPAGRAG